MEYDEHRIVELLGALPPEPAGWAAVAREMPRARRALDAIEGVVTGHARQPAREEDLVAELAAAGYEPTPALLRAIRATRALD
jgi:hypothetical protein